MNVSVVVPWRGGCPHRDAAWRHVRNLYETEHPDWEIVTGTDAGGAFSRSQAILDGARRSSGDVLVIADADVWCDPAPAVAKVAETGWAIPHTLIHRLSEDSTAAALDGADWQGLPLSTDNRQDSRPYRGNETGTLVVFDRYILGAVSPDPRFVGWGQEDVAWSIALRTLVGAPWRGDADLVHFWHPPQERRSRIVGSVAGEALATRYRRARNRPMEMRSLIEEVAGWTPHT